MKTPLLGIPLDYVSQPPLLEDFSFLEKRTERNCKTPAGSHKARNMTHPIPTSPGHKSSHPDLPFKQWLQWSQEWSGSPPLNVSPLCRCDRSSSENLQTEDCRLHGCAADGSKSIVFVQTSSRRNSLSESEHSSSSSSSTSGRDNHNESLISDPKLKLSQNLQENHMTLQTEEQFNLGAWFLHTLNISERRRERVADRNRLDVQNLPIHMKEQLKRIYVY